MNSSACLRPEKLLPSGARKNSRSSPLEHITVLQGGGYYCGCCGSGMIYSGSGSGPERLCDLQCFWKLFLTFKYRQSLHKLDKLCQKRWIRSQMELHILFRNRSSQQVPELNPQLSQWALQKKSTHSSGKTNVLMSLHHPEQSYVIFVEQ
jgi:hypothetical protein